MLLELQNLSCGYAKDYPVVSDVAFGLDPGEVCCVLGPNGCGKSTLFKTIFGQLEPLSGSILLDDCDVASMSAAEISHKLAYVPQTHQPPFPYTVEDAVMLGRTSRMGISSKPSAQDWAAVEDAMELMGIEEYRDTAYTMLSGGELQRVIIARALAQEPQVLVLDEPTAALDFANALNVIEIVRLLAREGYAIVMATHSPDHAFMAHSKVVLLGGGRMMAFGDASAVITEQGLRDAYGIDVDIVGFEQEDGSIMRLCAPTI